LQALRNHGVVFYQQHTHGVSSDLSWNRQRVNESGSRSQRNACRPRTGQGGQTKSSSLLEIHLRGVAELIIQDFSCGARDAGAWVGLAPAPFQAEFMIRIGAAIKHGHHQHIGLFIVVNTTKIIRLRAQGGQCCGSQAEERKPGTENRPPRPNHIGPLVPPARE
jgi:hypothetical protein